MRVASPVITAFTPSVQLVVTLAALATATAALPGCAALSRRSGDQSGSEAGAPIDEKEALKAQVAEMRAQMTAMGTRVDSMDTRLGSINDKMDSTRVSIDNFLTNQKVKPVAAMPHPSKGAGGGVEAEEAPSDPEAGFAHDDAVQSYRRAMVLFQSKKYPEAGLAFSQFLESFPDHPLAGSAQFRVGDSYFQQREYKLAAQELGRVLTSYDRSPHVAETLRKLAESEDAIKQPESAARHRQMLTSLFPQSPAASGVAVGAASAAPAAAAGHEAAPAAHGESHDAEPAAEGGRAPQGITTLSVPTAPIAGTSDLSRAATALATEEQE